MVTITGFGMIGEEFWNQVNLPLPDGRGSLQNVGKNRTLRQAKNRA
jgi:hypothetical protein